MDMDTKFTLAILHQHDRFLRFKARLIARGIPADEAEEEAASWIHTNAVFNVAKA